jgi:hypothetical protein
MTKYLFILIVFVSAVTFSAKAQDGQLFKKTKVEMNGSKCYCGDIGFYGKFSQFDFSSTSYPKFGEGYSYLLLQWGKNLMVIYKKTPYGSNSQNYYDGDLTECYAELYSNFDKSERSMELIKTGRVQSGSVKLLKKGKKNLLQFDNFKVNNFDFYNLAGLEK